MGGLEHVSDPAVGTLVGAIKTQFDDEQRMQIGCELLTELRPDEKERIGCALIREADKEAGDDPNSVTPSETVAIYPRTINPPTFGGDGS